MGLYIQGLDMPKEFGNYSGRFTFCVSEDGVNIVGIDGKLYRCAYIKEPHGRLIDADALTIEMMDNDVDGVQGADYREITQIIADAPTVIGAEE